MQPPDRYMTEVRPEAGEQGSERGEGAPGEDSILGSLPRSRPAVRSPRRDAAARARAKRQSAPGAGGGTTRPGKAEPEAPGDLEEMARAGVTTAAQVAAAGLRFAGRAASAIRDSLASR
jgi:hypothetical protein